MPKRRPFATGSKPGPDAIDHYLETKGFYRKHAARDASSLFRAVAEQVLDIQGYHEEFRQGCAAYMEKYSKEYSKEVDKNFYNYLANLRKSRTSGTLLELRVLARIYKKNVILFEPNQNNTECTQREYVHDDSYFEKPLLVYYSHKDRHFDAIYAMEYIEVLADTQAIVHEILYTDAYKIADVRYAVERMLHDQKGDLTKPLPDDETKYMTENGEIFEFDSAENTCCVLKDPDTCHFHNQKNFDELVKKNKDAITIINRSDDPGRLKVFKPVDGYLYKKEKSCVRQLLDDNITPFPFKVAKALDRSIYRNMEFEVWQDSRKESRQKWCDIDEKFIIYEGDPRLSPYSVPYYCDFGYVIDEFSCDKIDDIDYTKGKMNSLAGYDIFEPQMHPPYDQVDHIVMPVHQMHYNDQNYRPNHNNRGNGHRVNQHRETYYNQNRYNNQNRNNHYNNHQNRNDHYNNHQYVEQDVHVYNQNQQQQQQQQQQVYNQQVPQPVYGQPQYGYIDQVSPPPIYQYGTQNYQQVPATYPQQGFNQNQVQNANYAAPPIQADFSVPPPQIPANNNNVQNYHAQQADEQVVVAAEKNAGDYMHLIRDEEMIATNINFEPTECCEANGNVLPTDAATLQFYYNLGVRYFLAMGLQRRPEPIAVNAEQQGDQQQADDIIEMPPPVPTNTPVAQRTNYNNNYNGNRGQYNGNNGFNNNNNFRRNNNQNHRGGDHHYNGRGRNGYNNNNYHHQQNQINRKEIQFNSNVKNAHKVESNPPKGNQLNGHVQTPPVNGIQQDPPHQTSPDSVKTDSTGYGSEAQQVMPQTVQQAMPQAVQQAMPQTVQQAMPQAVQQVMPQTPHQAMPQTLHQAMPQTPHQGMPQTPHQAMPQAPQTVQQTFNGPPPQIVPQSVHFQQRPPVYQGPVFIPHQQPQMQVPVQNIQQQQPRIHAHSQNYQQQQHPKAQAQSNYQQAQQQNHSQQPQQMLVCFHQGNGFYLPSYYQQPTSYYQQSPPQQHYVNNNEIQYIENGNEMVRFNQNAGRQFAHGQGAIYYQNGTAYPQPFNPMVYQEPPQRTLYFASVQQTPVVIEAEDAQDVQPVYPPADDAEQEGAIIQEIVSAPLDATENADLPNSVTCNNTA